MGADGPFVAEHVERSHAFDVALPAARAIELFTPEGERAWAEGWDPAYLHPRDGRAGAGLVFTTDHGGEHTVWTMVRHEPQDGFVQYVRHTPGSRVGLVTVKVRPLEEGRSRVHVTYALTALGEAGNEMLRGLDAGAFSAFLESWEKSIGRLLSGPR